MSLTDDLTALQMGAQQITAAGRKSAVEQRTKRTSTKRPRPSAQPVTEDAPEMSFEEVVEVEGEDSQKAEPPRRMAYDQKYSHHYVWLIDEDTNLLVMGCAHKGCGDRRVIAGEHEWDLSRTTPMDKLIEMAIHTQESHDRMCAPSVWQACPGGRGGSREQPDEEWF